MLQELQKIVKNLSPAVKEISDFIFQNPECSMAEYAASSCIASFLSGRGFLVHQGVGGLDTALKCWYTNTTDPGTPAVCITAEYDALPGLGHGCGHNLITATALAAALAAVEYAAANGISLRLCFMGTPGEEACGGKVIMLREGVFDDIDMALMSHPASRHLPEVGALGVNRATISFYGKAAHAGSAPHEGINALDALHYFYADILEWKKRIDARERVHGIFTECGKAANIIPDHTEAFFYVRSPEAEGLKKLMRQLENSVRKGAEKTSCRGEINWQTPYMPIKKNNVLNKRYVELWHTLGVTVPEYSEEESCASTDMGNVTRAIPAAHFHFNATGGKDIPLHSTEFRDAAGSDTGFAGAMETAPVLAGLLLEYSADGDFRRQVDADFQQNI